MQDTPPAWLTLICLLIDWKDVPSSTFLNDFLGTRINQAFPEMNLRI